MDRTCRPCASYAGCWKADGGRTYAELKDALVRMQCGLEDDMALILGDYLYHRCVRPDVLMAGLSWAVHWAVSQRDWEERMATATAALVDQLLASADVLSGESIEENFLELSTIAHQCWVGLARRAARRSSCCGDSYLVRRCGSSILVGLSDGMGAGDRAARTSGPLLELIGSAFDVGLPLPWAIEHADRLVTLRGREHEVVTVDMARIDLQLGLAELYKRGAPPSFLVRSHRCLALSRPAPPLGIGIRIQTPRLRVRLRPGDHLVLVTDGCLDWGSYASLCAWLSQADVGRSADWLAARFLEWILERRGGEISDDMTVLVVKMAST